MDEKMERCGLTVHRSHINCARPIEHDGPCATIEIVRLERKLARARAARDKARAELRAMQKLGRTMTNPAVGYWHGEYMKVRFPPPTAIEGKAKGKEA